MPLILDKTMPIYSLLQREDPGLLADHIPDHRVHLLLFNLMSDKIQTELQYLRCLGTSKHYIQVEFLRQVSFTSPRQDVSYLEKYYLTEQDIASRSFDAMLITGAPLEHISCEDTLYWNEFCRIMQWSKTHVKSTFGGCWGAFAGVHWNFGIPKTNLNRKLSGIYPLQCPAPTEPLFRGLSQPLLIPLSRATDMDRQAVDACQELVLLAHTQSGSPVFLKSKDNRYIYCTGHPEYELDRLAMEYARDFGKEKAWVIPMPENYFANNDPAKPPVDTWTAQGQQLFRNWIEYYVV